MGFSKMGNGEKLRAQKISKLIARKIKENKCKF